MTGTGEHGVVEFLDRIRLPARRPTFASEDRESARSVRLASGPARPPLVGVPSTVALCGPHQYLEFAKHFRERRDVHALHVPGFVAGERLPLDVRAAVAAEAQAIRDCCSEQPPVLAGYSSGGTLAYGIAGELQALGAAVAAVVLIDAYPFGAVRSNDDRTQALLRRMFDDNQLRMYLNATRLSAMAWYTRLFEDWELPPVAVPTLLVQPTDPMPGMAADGEWESVWPHPHSSVRVAGDHWTMMIEHAQATAEAVDGWLSAELGA